MRRLCSVSVDLDPISCYTRIHGLAPPVGIDPVYEYALPRFLELFAELGVRGTFFTIGADVEEDAHAELLRRAVAEGHEIANHSLDHPYNLPDLDEAEARRQIVGAHRAIEERVGVSMVGFRAPGYNVDERVLHILDGLGYEYDSSVFPCPPYYLAKGAVMAAIRLRGGRSGSSMVRARTQIAPTRPYRPSLSAIHRRAKPTDRARTRLVELPMCVMPALRVPVIGTSMIMAGPRGAAAMVAGAALHHRRFLNLELHGIDLSDADRDGISDALRARQPDLRKSVEHKLETFRQAFGAAARRKYRFVPCAEAARELRVGL